MASETMTAFFPGQAPSFEWKNRQQSDQRVSPPSTRSRSKSSAPYHKLRVLLALDGRHLTDTLLTSAVPRCVEYDRLDILLVNAPKAPTKLLRILLLRLEHSGIDYRLASTDGDLGAQVQIYLQRFLGISVVLFDGQSGLAHQLASTLPGREHQFVPI